MVSTGVLVRLDGAVRKRVYLAYHRARALCVRPRRLKVLFSRFDQWEPMIRAGLAGTPHVVAFAELARTDLLAYDVVVPLTTDAVHFLAASPMLALRNLLPVPDVACVALCDDKFLLNQALTRLGFGDCIPPMLAAPTPPYILKPRIGVNSENCHLVRSAEQHEKVRELIASPAYYCQELVSGTSEFATHILFRGGSIAAELTIEYVAAEPVFIKGNCRFTTTRLRRCQFPELFTRMLLAIGFQGLCCFNYKVEGGQVRLLEINPRFGYSLGPYFSVFLSQISTRPADSPQPSYGQAGSP